MRLASAANATASRTAPYTQRQDPWNPRAQQHLVSATHIRMEPACTSGTAASHAPPPPAGPRSTPRRSAPPAPSGCRPGSRRGSRQRDRPDRAANSMVHLQHNRVAAFIARRRSGGSKSKPHLLPTHLLDRYEMCRGDLQVGSRLQTSVDGLIDRSPRPLLLHLPLRRPIIRHAPPSLLGHGSSPQQAGCTATEVPCGINMTWNQLAEHYGGQPG